MRIDVDRLAKQIALAYTLINAVHLQAIDVIREVETQLRTARNIRCLQPRGYGYYTDPLSTSIARPQAQVASSFTVYLRRFEDEVEQTPFDARVPPIAFLKVVLRERGMQHPEVRFGVLTHIERASGRPESKFEDIAYRLADRALGGPAWIHRGKIECPYEDAYVTLDIEGSAVRLADLTDSETIAKEIVEPLLRLFSHQESDQTRGQLR